MNATSDDPKPKAAEDWKPEVSELFYYPIDGRFVMCRRLGENSEGITMQIVEGDCCDDRPQLISKEFYGAIRRMDMPGITPPCNCPAPEQQLAFPVVTAIVPQA